MNPHEFDLEHIFTYHAPSDLDVVAYQEIRLAAKAFAQVILDNQIREAVMVANATRALDGRLHVS